MLRITIATTSTTFLTVVLLGPASPATLVQAPGDGRAVKLVRAAIEQIGGEEKLRALKGVQLGKIGKIGHTYWIEQSERPEGPWLLNYDQVYGTARLC